MEFWSAVIAGAVLFVLLNLPKWLANNRESPDGYKTNWDEMSRDRSKGMKEGQIDLKTIRGEYDIPDNRK